MRGAYDLQPVEDVPFWLTPYLGLTVGGAALSGVGGFLLGATGGLEMKFMIDDSFLLGLRPIGLHAPVLFGSRLLFGFVYEAALLLGGVL